jgi:hypothetical protein
MISVSCQWLQMYKNTPTQTGIKRRKHVFPTKINAKGCISPKGFTVTTFCPNRQDKQERHTLSDKDNDNDPICSSFVTAKFQRGVRCPHFLARAISLYWYPKVVLRSFGSPSTTGQM